jgi:hypothetical protein
LGLAAILTSGFAPSCPAELIADVYVSTASIPPRGKPSRAGAGLKEGKPLEMAAWGGGGAIVGSLGGPIGAMIGAGAGALCGLLYSVFVVPHNGPAK